MTSSPKGDNPGLFGPDSVTWRVHADPLFAVGCLRGLFLQALHPLAMAGVAAHSNFREDTLGRLVRTAEYLAVTAYGTTAEAEAMLARVRKVHTYISGVDRKGRAYAAGDPDLLLWVHVALIESILEVTRRGGFDLSAAEADAYVAEQGVLAEALGVPSRNVPDDVSELRAALDNYRPVLEVTSEARDALRFVLVPRLPLVLELGTPARPAWTALAALSWSCLPDWALGDYDMGLPQPPEFVTTAALRTFRGGVSLVPEGIRGGPHRRQALARLA